MTPLLSLLALALTLSMSPSAGPAAAPTQVPAPGSRLTLRNGTTYLLKEPPQISGTRVIFTTMDGRSFSMDESEIDTIGAAPRPTAAPRRYDQEDSHALGAIARQQRETRGKRAEVAPRAPVRKKTPRPSRTPRPRRTSPARGRAGDTASPG